MPRAVSPEPSLHSIPLDLSPAVLDQLRASALAAAAHSHAPYSRFHVGAALLLESGTVVTGCNVENASFRLSTCAEQAAIVRAVAEFGPSIRLRAVAVANPAAVPCTPCGACRQTLLEFSPDPTAVLVLFPGQSTDGSLCDQHCTLADLLPSAFHL